MRILIVEGRKRTGNAIARGLNKRYASVTAYDGEEAL